MLSRFKILIRYISKPRNENTTNIFLIKSLSFHKIKRKKQKYSENPPNPSQNTPAAKRDEPHKKRESP